MPAEELAQKTSKLLPEQLDTTSEAVVDLADDQIMAHVSLKGRDSSRHRYSSASANVSQQANASRKPVQRHDSVRNVLKLFRLRQENFGDMTGETGRSATTNGIGPPHIENDVRSTSDTDTQSPVSPRPDKQKHADVKTKASKTEQSSEKQRFLPREPVYALRREYKADDASLKLLGRSEQHKNISLKRKHFVHQKRVKACALETRTTNAGGEPENVIQLNTVSVQANDFIEAVVPPACASKETSASASTQQNDFGPEKGSPMTQECEVAHSVSVNVSTQQKGAGIQCRLSEHGLTNGGRRNSPLPLSIADKYPIWVNLNGGSHFKEKKYLQVAGFGDPNAAGLTTNNDATALTIMPSATVLQKDKLDDGHDENQSDGQRSISMSSSQSQEKDTADIDDVLKAKYRTTYQEHYPVHERLSSDDREVPSGINPLIDLYDNMQRMTHRLRVLETCANSIDEEFKITQKRLSRIGDTHRGGSSSRSTVLEDIDEVLEIPEESGRRVGECEPPTGLLSKKASVDMETAKKLLETIEQLTTGKDDK